MTQPNSSNGHAASLDAMVPGTQRPGVASRRTTRCQKSLAVLVVVYGLVIAGLCLWMFWQGGRQWIATLILFGPRWMSGIPLPFLTIAAAVWHRRLLWVLAATALVLVFPFMGFKAHWPAPATSPVSLRVMTCNVDQNALSPDALAALILMHEPDVVALQEVNWATKFLWPKGWHVLNHDEFTVASPWPISEEDFFIHPLRSPEVVAICYRVQVGDRHVQLFNLHLFSPRPGIEAVLTGHPVRGAAQLDAILEVRSIESEGTSDWIAGFAGPKIVMGDFNMPSESAIFRRDWTRLADAFARTGWGFGFTKISGKGLLSYGSRIDHVLYDDTFRCVRSWVGENIDSDHLPLFAEFR